MIGHNSGDGRKRSFVASSCKGRLQIHQNRVNLFFYAKCSQQHQQVSWWHHNAKRVEAYEQCLVANNKPSNRLILLCLPNVLKAIASFCYWFTAKSCWDEMLVGKRKHKNFAECRSVVDQLSISCRPKTNLKFGHKRKECLRKLRICFGHLVIHSLKKFVENKLIDWSDD